MLNDDYYSIDFEGGSFYYGYECSYCQDCEIWLRGGQDSCEDHSEVWGFHGKIGDFERRYPVTMGDQFNVVGKMESGIRVFMNEFLESHTITPK